MRDDDDDLSLKASRTPLIASSFTAWRYQKMHEVVHFCASQDNDPPNFIEYCLVNGLVFHDDVTKMSPLEKRNLANREEEYYKKNWQEVLYRMV